MTAIGVTVKSGWAAAVVAERKTGGVRICQSSLLDLCDPAVPDSKQPFHDGFATMRTPGPALTKLLAASLSLRGLLFRGDRGRSYAETARWLRGSSVEELLAA